MSKTCSLNQATSLTTYLGFDCSIIGVKNAPAENLMPITINRFAIVNGSVELQNAWAEPRVDIEVAKVNFNIENIRNVVEAGEALPSPFLGSADFPGYGGNFHITGDAQLLKTTPDFNYDARLEDFDLVKMNELAKYYAGIDFEKGQANIYSELAMADGRFTGYVKPLLKDVQIFSRNEGDRSVGQYFKELFAEGITELFENHRKDQLATRVPLQGNIEGTNTNIWTAIIAVIRNAYFEAFQPELDASVEFEDALPGNEKEDKPGFFKRLFNGDDKEDNKWKKKQE